MDLNSVKVLAVVPARGGSKGIPRKNLSVVAGKSLIEHAAQTIMATPCIDAAIVSTDDTEISQEATRCGLDCPFLRPYSLSTDTATSVDTWAHAWRSCEAYFQTRFDISLLLEPTSPMRRPSDLQSAIEMVIQSGFAAVASVSQSPGHYTPQKLLTLDEQRLSYYLSDGTHVHRRQDIRGNYYFRNGICYAATRSRILEEGKILGENCGALVISRPVSNIDHPLDLAWTEFLLNQNAPMQE